MFAQRANDWVLGDPMDPQTQMGPLCNAPHWHDVVETTQKAIGEGAIALAGGSAPSGAGKQGGWYYCRQFWVMLNTEARQDRLRYLDRY